MADHGNNLEFGLYKIDLDRVIRLLKQDIKDDWFQDPLLFEDRLSKDVIINYFKENIKKNDGNYKPITKEIMNIPKKHASLRYSLETCFYDRVAFHAFGTHLIKYFDKLISRRVFNHRLDQSLFKKKKHRYLFANSIEQWRKYEEFIRVGAIDKTILKTDIQDFYENIKITDLKRILLVCLREVDVSSIEISTIRFCIDNICSCLETWSYNGTNGLPQNRDISSFLANIYLYPIDTFMVEEGFDYYRYMDDIQIICKDKFQARSVLKKVIIELRKIGLNVNSAKTHILEPSAKEHIEFLRQDSYELERIDYMLRTKKKPIVAIAFTEVRDMLINIIKNNDFRTRKFRFLMNRICKIALCNDIKKPPDFFSQITKGIINYIGEIPDATDHFYAYLVSVETKTEDLNKLQDYLLNERKAIYSWQNYLLWKLLAYKKHINQELLDHAKNVIKESSKLGNISGALLYLGKCGDLGCKKDIANDFHKLKGFFTQRHALISIQELKYEDIESKVEPHILTESIGIYRTLHNYSTPKYLEPPKPIKFTDLIREISFYA